MPDRSPDDHPRVTNSEVSCPTSGDKPVDSVDNADTHRGESGQTALFATEAGYPQLRGSDLAKAALQAAKDASASAGHKKNKQVRSGFSGSRRRRRWSGARPDDRDPQPLGRLTARIATERGWAGQLATGQLFGRWSAIVGEDVAEHAQPMALREGELTIQAASTAWATQLRLLQRQLLAKIAAGVGDGVVTKLKVHGPSAPSWRHGTRHVSGRGPRDTYG